MIRDLVSGEPSLNELRERGCVAWWGCWGLTTVRRIRRDSFAGGMKSVNH